jgi:iron complex outermembrane receptor protein
VTWRPGSGTPATPIYLNEIPFDPAQTIQSIFDVGQIEVLRGPQGTTRGAPSISGAVTITTRHPDLEEFGGYVQGLYGTADHWDGQGAVNFPLIKDMLAIRVAGNFEDSEDNRVYSLHNAAKPFRRDHTERITALFKPIDTLSFEAMYQHKRQSEQFYSQVVGSGSPGSVSAGIPPNFNGPALTDRDRKSVEDLPSITPDYFDLLTASANWDVLGQQLSYNYGRQISHAPPTFNAQDPGDFLPGYEPQQTVRNGRQPFFQTQEFRLASIHDPARFFDYDVGYFQKHSGGPIEVDIPVFLSGAFGAPGTLPGVVTAPNSRYVLKAHTDIDLGQVYDSVYGNLQLHLWDNTELSGGVAHIRDRIPVNLTVTTDAAYSVAVPLSLLQGLPCPGIPGVIVLPLVNSIYPGYCDAAVPAGSGNSVETHNDKYSKTIYDVSLSHKFSDNVLAYATTGTSYRSGLPAIANTGLPPGFLTPLPETATSYEVGAKTTWGRRLRINADIFQINYDNQLTAFEGIQYFNSVANTVNATSIAFYRNVDARVRGAELEIAAEPIDRLSLGANFSYAPIKSRGGAVPCNDPTRPITATNRIDECASASGQALNQSAPLQATIDGSYTVPVGSLGGLGPLDGYFRFNLNHQGNNPNYGNILSTQAYEIVDLFAGLTGNKDGWELGVYAKNVFDKQVELSRVPILNTIYPNYTSAQTGYFAVRVSAPREIGASVRYAFGSR